jgi:hypothetical protein
MKDSYYFPHDSNAKDDPKVVLMIEQLGLEAYGIYWVLIELLRDQPDYRYPLQLIPAMARRYNTTSEKMKTVVMAYNLFEVENDEFFFSRSLLTRMEYREMIRDKKRLAGRKSAEARQKLLPEFNTCSTDVQQVFSTCGTSVEQGKERKGKEIKGKESIDFTPLEVSEDSAIMSFESIRDRMTSDIWLDTVCRAKLWNKAQFAAHVNQWLLNKKLSNTYNYKLGSLKEFCIRDFKPDAAAGTTQAAYIPPVKKKVV